MLLGIILEPVLPAPSILVAGRLVRPRIPIRPFPPRRFSKARADSGQAIVQNAFLHPARSFPLTERPMVLVPDSERFDHTVGQVAWVVLPWVAAADIHGPDIDRSMSIDDPIR